MSRYHLHAAKTVDGKVGLQTQEASTEVEAASVAAILAKRGFVVWLYEHDHVGPGDEDSASMRLVDDGGAHGAYREIGMFIGNDFLPNRKNSTT